MSRLQSIMLLVRDAPKSAQFFKDVLGLPVRVAGETLAEVHTGSARLIIQAVPAGSEAPLSTGYSPFLNFSVEDLNTSIYKAMELGASMDGAIVYGHTGKTVSIRTPDGHMVGLHEAEEANAT